MHSLQLTAGETIATNPIISITHCHTCARLHSSTHPHTETHAWLCIKLGCGRIADPCAPISSTAVQQRRWRLKDWLTWKTTSPPHRRHIGCQGHTHPFYWHTHTHTRARTHIHTHAHAYVRTHTHSHTHVCTLTQTHTYTYTHTRARAQGHAHEHAHTHTHTHIHTHTHTQWLRERYTCRGTRFKSQHRL